MNSFTWKPEYETSDLKSLRIAEKKFNVLMNETVMVMKKGSSGSKKLIKINKQRNKLQLDIVGLKKILSESKTDEKMLEKNKLITSARKLGICVSKKIDTNTKTPNINRIRKLEGIVDFGLSSIYD